MITDGIIGHEEILKRLIAWTEAPANGYLFHGLSHLGKRTVAERFVMSLLGTSAIDLNRAHPDLILVEPEEGKANIPAKIVREARARCSSKPMVAPRQVIYLPAADRLNTEGANALLKVLEEPPAGAVFILVAEDRSRLPETVHSRIIPIAFSPVASRVIREGLIARGHDPLLADRVIKVSRGRPGLAIEPPELADDSAERFLRASSLGERIAILESASKACDGAVDSVSAWSMLCDDWTHVLRGALAAASDAGSGRRVHVVAEGVVNARRCVGTSVSPRMALEQAAIRLDLI